MAEFASKGVAGTGLGLGIAGTALGVLSGGLGNILGGWGNNGATEAVTTGLAAAIPSMIAASGARNGSGNCSENTPVTRYEMNLVEQLGQKDSHIALLEADKYTDQKIVDTYVTLHGEIKDLAAEVRANKETQTAINQEQAVYNGVNTATLNCLRGQVDQLYSLTALKIPNSSVCPGWGNVEISADSGSTTSR